uniref:Uncharacterized protein n=1 Tax=Trichogramma kaykai TaxID=54128 RepID=A0ABD2WX84_9HYME
MTDADDDSDARGRGLLLQEIVISLHRRGAIMVSLEEHPLVQPKLPENVAEKIGRRLATAAAAAASLASVNGGRLAFYSLQIIDQEYHKHQD